MHIKGEFRDVLKSNEEVIEDRGWKSNKIVPDLGKFLAAVMKKDFKGDSNNSTCVGIEYIAVGCGSNNPDVFKSKVSNFFKNVATGQQKKPYPNDTDPNNWVWVKQIDPTKINYLGINTVTNILKIEVQFDSENPENSNPLSFSEFSLLGYNKQGTNTDSDAKIFFINYATHGVITKEKDMILTRTIQLTFDTDKLNDS